MEKLNTALNIERGGVPIPTKIGKNGFDDAYVVGQNLDGANPSNVSVVIGEVKDYAGVVHADKFTAIGGPGTAQAVKTFERNLAKVEEGIINNPNLSEAAKAAALDAIRNKRFKIEIVTRKGAPRVSQEILDHLEDVTGMPAGSIVNAPYQLPQGGYLPEGTSIQDPFRDLIEGPR